MTKNIPQIFLELCQVWCHDHFPGKHVLVANHPPSEEHFPNVQGDLLLMQLHSTSSCSVAIREISSTSLSTESSEQVLDCDPSAFSSPR